MFYLFWAFYFQGFRITFLPLSCLEKLELFSRPKYHSKFDLVFIGCSLTHLLEDRIFKILKGTFHYACHKDTSTSQDMFSPISASGHRENSPPLEPILFVETPLFLLHMADQVQTKYKEHLQEICSTMKCSKADLVQDADDDDGSLVLMLRLEDYNPKEEAIVKATANFISH